jgi:hypothetical protein
VSSRSQRARIAKTRSYHPAAAAAAVPANRRHPRRIPKPVRVQPRAAVAECQAAAAARHRAAAAVPAVAQLRRAGRGARHPRRASRTAVRRLARTLGLGAFSASVELGSCRSSELIPRCATSKAQSFLSSADGSVPPRACLLHCNSTVRAPDVARPCSFTLRGRQLYASSQANGIIRKSSGNRYSCAASRRYPHSAHACRGDEPEQSRPCRVLAHGHGKGAGVLGIDARDDATSGYSEPGVHARGIPQVVGRMDEAMVVTRLSARISGYRFSRAICGFRIEPHASTALKCSIKSNRARPESGSQARNRECAKTDTHQKATVVAWTRESGSDAGCNLGLRWR